jgi:metal-sulfur cluster biosynthetic enzyme
MNAMDETTVRDALRTVVDPEIGLNIVDLGLVYSAVVHGGVAIVKMTLTTQGCPMHESLVEGVRTVLLDLPGVKDAEIEVVWDPPWHPSMISESAKAGLGIA